MNDTKTTYSEKRSQKPYNSPFLTTNEASGFLRLKPKTLINRRALGLGPRYRTWWPGCLLYGRPDQLEQGRG
ncbi:hypothetical protein MNBD_ALPHA02-185 [hydrothermal vent metagenome]|uniref:DNA-binding protein n=1 Tax=hydrothermal vent metagenome TaxID=652676 RepID=A0A3B0S6H8_9ZZZZ